MVVIRLENCLVNFDENEVFKRRINRERWRELKDLKILEEKRRKCFEKLKSKLDEKKRVVELGKLEFLEKEREEMMDERMRKIVERNKRKVSDMMEREEEIKMGIKSNFRKSFGNKELGIEIQGFFRDFEGLRKWNNIKLVVIGMGGVDEIERLLYNNGLRNFSVKGYCREGDISSQLKDVEDLSKVVVYSNNEKDIEDCGRNGIKICKCDWNDMEEVWKGIGVRRRE